MVLGEHPDTGVSLIKARHPEFELWNQAVHARSGVPCADGHMLYTRLGGLKIRDHQVNGPLLKIICSPAPSRQSPPIAEHGSLRPQGTP
jgi:formate-dependent nitrite reductase cytochrome c552 subunit